MTNPMTLSDEALRSLAERLGDRYMDTKRMIPVEDCHAASSAILALMAERDEQATTIDAMLKAHFEHAEERHRLWSRLSRAIEALREIVDRNVQFSGESAIAAFASHGEALMAYRKARSVLSELEEKQ